MGVTGAMIADARGGTNWMIASPYAGFGCEDLKSPTAPRYPLLIRKRTEFSLVVANRERDV
jgi:hypothetical protein